MEYICQLRRGYMLVEEKGKYKIERTGYPYPDTRLSSQEMLNELLEKLEIKQTNSEITISLLADKLEPVFDNGIVFDKKSLKNCIEGITFDERVAKGYVYSVFFSSPILSIYYFYNETDVEKYLNDFAIKASSFSNTVSGAMLVLHLHVDKNTVKLPEPFSRDKEPNFKIFDNLFKLNYKVSVEQIESLLRNIEKQRGSLMKDGLLCLSSPFEDFYAVDCYIQDDKYADELNLSVVLQSLFNCVDDSFSFKESVRGFSKSHLLPSVMEEIYGYNIMRGLTNFVLGLSKGSFVTFYLSCVAFYFEKEPVTKCILKTRIKALVSEMIAQRGIDTLAITVVTTDEGTHIRTLPFVYEVFKNHGENYTTRDKFLTGLLLDGNKDNSSLVKDEDGTWWYDVDLSKIQKGVSSYENKLFQFFVVVSLNRLQLDNLELGHTCYSDRNVMKTIVPNFDRLMLMGAIKNINLSSILAALLNISIFTSYSNNKVARILDNALDEVDYFTDEEKSFIMVLPLFLRVREEYDDSTCVRMEILNDDCSAEEIDLFKPRFREGFVEHLEPMLKMITTVSLCASPHKVQQIMFDNNISCDFDGLSFTVSFKKRRVIQ